MNISDVFSEHQRYGDGGYPQYDDFDYFAVENRRAEERDGAEYQAWLKKYREWAATPRNYTGPYCHRCGAKVDYKDTGDLMDPIRVMDRNTNVNHRIRCYDRRR